LAKVGKQIDTILRYVVDTAVEQGKKREKQQNKIGWDRNKTIIAELVESQTTARRRLSQQRIVCQGITKVLPYKISL
jgi:ATP-dependent protease HslVU (ClpYQ) ATPase subunit